MNKEEYYKRMSKIDARARTDRTSADEDYHIACQRYYLSNQYIKTLEQENKELKARFDRVIECIEKEYYSKNTTDINKVIGNREVAIYRILKGE